MGKRNYLSNIRDRNGWPSTHKSFCTGTSAFPARVQAASQCPQTRHSAPPGGLTARRLHPGGNGPRSPFLEDILWPSDHLAGVMLNCAAWLWSRPEDFSCVRHTPTPSLDQSKPLSKSVCLKVSEGWCVCVLAGSLLQTEPDWHLQIGCKMRPDYTIKSFSRVIMHHFKYRIQLGTVLITNAVIDHESNHSLHVKHVIFTIYFILADFTGQQKCKSQDFKFSWVAMVWHLEVACSPCS